MSLKVMANGGRRPLEFIGRTTPAEFHAVMAFIYFRERHREMMATSKPVTKGKFTGEFVILARTHIRMARAYGY